MIYKNITYTISHVFLMLFMYLFIVHRYSKKKTAGVCVTSALLLTVTDLLKLNFFPDSQLCYLIVTKNTGIRHNSHQFLPVSRS